MDLKCRLGVSHDTTDPRVAVRVYDRREDDGESELVRIDISSCPCESDTCVADVICPGCGSDHGQDESCETEGRLSDA